LAESKRVLEDQLRRPVRWFAYPYGGRDNFRPEHLPLVARAGYEACFSGHSGFITAAHRDKLLLPREPVPYFRSLLHLEVHLTGCLNWYYALKRRAGWSAGPPPAEVSIEPVAPAVVAASADPHPVARG
jgi:hypothetical protein